MENHYDASVDRQATFDTDPNRVRIKKGKLKLPVIDADGEEVTSISSTRVSPAENADTNVKTRYRLNNNDAKVSTGITETKHSSELTKNKTKDSDAKKKNVIKEEYKNSANESKSLNKTDIINPKTNTSNKEPAKEPDLANKTADKARDSKQTQRKKEVLFSPKTSGGKAEHKSETAKPQKAVDNIDASNTKNNKTSDSKEQVNKIDKATDGGNNIKGNTAKGKGIKIATPSNKDNSSEPQHTAKTAKSSVLKDLNSKRSTTPDKSPVKRSTSPKKNSKLSDTQTNTLKTDQSSSTSNTQKKSSSDSTKAEKQKPSDNSVREPKDFNKGFNKEKDSSKPNDLLATKTPNDKKVHVKTQKSNNDSAQADAPTVINGNKAKPNLTHEKGNKTASSQATTEAKTGKSKEDVILNQATTEKKAGKSKVDLHIADTTDKRSTDVKTSKNIPPVESNIYKSNEQFSEKLVNTKTDSVKKESRQAGELSPSSTNVKSSSKGADSSGSVSPNPAVEQIKIEKRPVSEKVNMDERNNLGRKESFEQVNAERNTLLKAEITYRKRIKQLEDEANGFLKTIDDLTIENRLLQGKVDLLEDDIKGAGNESAPEKVLDLQKENVKLEARVRELENQAKTGPTAASTDDSQSEIRELKSQVVKLQTENQVCTEENVKLKAEYYANVKKLNSLETEKNSLASSVTAVESEKLDKIQDLNNEHLQLKKELKKIKEKNTVLEKKFNSLEFENKALSETLAQKKTELGEIMGVMKDENKFDNEVKDLKNQVLKLQKEKKDSEQIHKKEKQIINETLSDAKSKLDTALKNADDLNVKSEEIEKDHATLKKEYNTLKKLADTQKAEIEELKAEIKRLNDELKENQEKYNKLLNETENANTDLKDAKKELEEFNKELQKVVSDKEGQISKLISQLDALREDKETEKKSVLGEKDKLVAEVSRLSVFEKNMGTMESELKHFVDKLEESHIKNKKVSIQLEDKGFHISNLEQQVFSLNVKLDNNSQRLSQLDKEKREMEHDRREWDVKRDKFNDIEASNKRLLEENKRLRSQLEMKSYVSPPEATAGTTREKPPVMEAWAGDKNSSNTTNQHAVYIQKEKEKKKVQISPHGNTTYRKQRAPFTKSSPVKSNTKVKVTGRETLHVSLSPSRSLEDLRKTSGPRTPESEHSLPELQRDTRLTTYGYSGYRDIHKNRIKNAAQKRIY